MTVIKFQLVIIVTQLGFITWQLSLLLKALS